MQQQLTKNFLPKLSKKTVCKKPRRRKVNKTQSKIDKSFFCAKQITFHPLLSITMRTIKKEFIKFVAHRARKCI